MIVHTTIDFVTYKRNEDASSASPSLHMPTNAENIRNLIEDEEPKFQEKKEKMDIGILVSVSRHLGKSGKGSKASRDGSSKSGKGSKASGDDEGKIVFVVAMIDRRIPHVLSNTYPTPHRSNNYSCNSISNHNNHNTSTGKHLYL